MALPTFVVLAVLAVVLFVLPASANAFNVANFNYANSSEPGKSLSGLQASGHPTVAISFNRQGSESEDIKDVRLDLPTGVFANPEAVTQKCTSTQFNGDSCPGASNVGTVDVTVKALGLLNLDIHGTVDILTPDANQVVTLGMTLRPERICILFFFCAQPQKIFLKTGITVKTYEDSGLRTYTPGAPKSAVIGIPLVFVTPTINGDITLNRMALNFQSRAGEGTTSQSCSGWGWFKTCTTTSVPPSGKYFFQQTGSCLPATSFVELVSYQNATSTATSTYTPNGCNNVPFDPQYTFEPANKNSNQRSPVTFDLTIPEADAQIQHALPKIVDVDLANGSGLDLNALTGVVGCTEAQLQARNCPAASIIGTANAFSKYLPGSPISTPGLVGNVYAMGVGNQIPIGVEVVGPRNTIIIFRGTMGTRGDANAGTGRVYATFDKIPQLPYSSFSLTIDKPVYKNPSTCGPATSTSVITGFNGGAPLGNGTVVNRSSSYTVVNCQTAPETTITNGPPTTTTNVSPTFTFSSDTPGSTFQCSLDGGGFLPCSTPFTTQPLSNGSHTFEVKALVGTVEDPTPASYTFTVATTGFTITPTITPSTTQAVAHPDVNADFVLAGGQPKEIALKLPRGFSASLDAVPTCLSAAAAAGSCTAASKVGTAELTVEKFGGVLETKTGDLFLTDGPTGADAGGISTKIEFDDGTFIAGGGAYLVENGRHQYLELRSIPSQIGGNDITVTRLQVALSGANDFLTNPSNCLLSDWAASATDYNNVDAPAFSVPFQATGCAGVPFNPQITQTLTSPVAGTETGVTADVTLDPGDSSITALRVSEPPSLSPNYPAFGLSSDQCSAAAAPTPTSVFDPGACPPQALAGSMTINTPLLPDPLEGDVYLIEKSPIPWLGVAFSAPGIEVRLTGVTATPQVDPGCDPLFDPLGFCQTQISILFNTVPDVPISSINFVLDGPTRAGDAGPLSGKILTVAAPTDPTCVPSSPAISLIAPYTGNPPVSRSQSIAISGCS
ncbi:MAG: hypothetical protein ACPGWS_00450 [Solirubrobacterales bacterium]